MIYETDQTAYYMHMRGASDEEIIAQLIADKKDLSKRVMDLEKIAPRKFTKGGKEHVWHCPNELVPNRNIQLP